MRAQIFGKTGKTVDHSFAVDSEIRVGRSPRNNLVLNHRLISNEHARLFFDENESAYFIEDLRSRNGVRVNGLRVQGREKLGNLAIITFAEAFEYIFQIFGDSSTAVGKSEKRAQTPAFAPEQKLPEKPIAQENSGMETRYESPPENKFDPASLPQAHTSENLQNGAGFQTVAEGPVHDNQPGKQMVEPGYENGTNQDTLPGRQTDGAVDESGHNSMNYSYYLNVPHSEQGLITFKLKKGLHVLGRQTDCNIVLEDATVGRHHAQIRVNETGVEITDLGSPNGTRINGAEIKPQEPVALVAGSTLSFGRLTAHFDIRKDEMGAVYASDR